MPSLIHSIILGLVQGLTEFLPISSSGHLILVPWLMGWEEHSMFFDISLHFATLFAVLIYFRKEWAHILLKERRFLWYIIAATVPAGLAGLFMGDIVEEHCRSPLSVAAMLGLFGLVLYLADFFGKKNKTLETITLKSYFLIGLSQMLAIIPGVSRSGITMSAALLLGFNRESSVRFSFLLIAPIVMAAGLKSVIDIAKTGYVPLSAPFFSGFIAAFLSSMIAIHFLVKYVKAHPFVIFVIYRLFVSAVISAMVFLIV